MGERRSPKAAATLAVRGLPHREMATLRLRRASEGDLTRLGIMLGVELPTTPNRAAGLAVRAIWIGPGEWLIIGLTASNEMVEAAASEAAVASCIRVGDGRCTYDVIGPDAAELLAKAVSIDLHPRVFLEGDTAMTLFDQVPVIIDKMGGDAFRLLFDISFRDYAKQWFRDALVEFGTSAEFAPLSSEESAMP